MQPPQNRMIKSEGTGEPSMPASAVRVLSHIELMS
jgi:hypothetical protein